MNISTKYFLFQKSDAKREVFLGASVYLTQFYTKLISKGNYKYRGWGVGLSVTLFDVEFVICIVPFITDKYTGAEQKFSKRIHAE